MPATADRSTPRRHPEAGANFVSYPVAADAVIYKGTMVALTAGYLDSAADAAGAVVVGIAEEAVDNTGGSNGDLRCVVVSGNAFRLTGTGIVAADVGKPAYVSDDQTVSDAAGTNGVVAGVIEELESANVVWVYIPHTNALAPTGVQAAALPSSAIALLQRTIQAGDIVAGHYDFDFAFTVASFSFSIRKSTGVPKDVSAITDSFAINSGNVRLTLPGGGTDLIAGDIVAVVASA